MSLYLEITKYSKELNEVTVQIDDKVGTLLITNAELQDLATDVLMFYGEIYRLMESPND